MADIRNLIVGLTLVLLLGVISMPGPAALLAGDNGAENILYVDAINGDDTNDGRTPQTAFATIQKGIDAAEEDYWPVPPPRSPGILATPAMPVTVLVYPGVYTEALNFKGKAITVASAKDAAILEAPADYAVSFYSGEGPASVLKNFVIRNSYLGIFLAGSSPTIANLTVVDNEFGIAAYARATPTISNCILWNNTDGDSFGCEATYSWVQQELPTERPEGLVSHWKFDEFVRIITRDSIGANHASVHGAQWTPGRVGGAFNLDGDGDYIEVPADASLEPEHITVSLWVRPIGGRYIITNSEEDDDGAFVVQLRANGDLQSIVHTHDVPRYGTVVSISKNQWHHVVMTYDGDRMKTYLDGNLMADDNVVDGPLPADGNKLYMGNREQGDRDFDGTLDEVMIFSRALFAGEVRAMYMAAVTGVFDIDPLFVDPENGDYHLRSERGRYWPEHGVWVLDDVTSPCVDAGDPSMGPVNERMPNGGRINMGAYGGTPYASMSEWPIAGDLNRNGIVDLSDLGVFCEQWLAELPVTSIFSPDSTPPQPNPAQWAPDGQPKEVYGGAGVFDYRVEMTAVQATDASGSVEYFFECTSQPGWSSRWQASNSYTVLVGQGGQALRFRVKARDLYGNETAWSEELPALPAR